MKKGPKVSHNSSWLKRSLELEAEIGDDSEAYNVNDDELEELLVDDDEPLDEDEDLDYVEDEEDEDEDPPLVWDDDLEDYV